MEEKKRGLKEFIKNNFISLFVVCVIIILPIAIAGNVIVNEGSMNIENNLNVSGVLYTNGTNVGMSSNNPLSKLSINFDGDIDVGGISVEAGSATWALWANGPIYYSDNNFIGEGIPSSVNPNKAKLQINDSSQNFPRMIFTGQEFYQGTQTSGEGLAFLLGVNRQSNRQLWLADSQFLNQNSTNSILRFGVGGSSVPTIDALATDGTSKRNLSLQSSGGNVGIGTNNPQASLDVQGTAIRMPTRTTAPFTCTSGVIGAQYLDISGSDDWQIPCVCMYYHGVGYVWRPVSHDDWATACA